MLFDAINNAFFSINDDWLASFFFLLIHDDYYLLLLIYGYDDDGKTTAASLLLVCGHTRCCHFRPVSSISICSKQFNEDALCPFRTWSVMVLHDLLFFVVLLMFVLLLPFLIFITRSNVVWQLLHSELPTIAAKKFYKTASAATYKQSSPMLKRNKLDTTNSGRSPTEVKPVEPIIINGPEVISFWTDKANLFD